MKDTGPFAGISRYIYGTTRLGDAILPLADRVKIARAAMDAGVWFHTSHRYGGALRVLGLAFAEDRARVPKLIFKLGGDDIGEMRELLRRQLEPLGVDHMDIAQLCLGGEMAEQFRSGGACYGEFRRWRDEGLVRQFVVEVFPWTSRAPLEALRAGHAKGVVDGCIFYLNPLQRFAANALWDFIAESHLPVIAMRTVCGAPVQALRDEPGAAWKDYLQERAVEVARFLNARGLETGRSFACGSRSAFSRFGRRWARPAGARICRSFCALRAIRGRCRRTSSPTQVPCRGDGRKRPTCTRSRGRCNAVGRHGITACLKPLALAGWGRSLVCFHGL